MADNSGLRRAVTPFDLSVTAINSAFATPGTTIAASNALPGAAPLRQRAGRRYRAHTIGVSMCTAWLDVYCMEGVEMALNTAVKDQFTGFSETQRAFLAPPRYGTIATLRPDGTPMLFTVWYDLDGDDIWFISRPHNAKIRQLERDPRIAFHVVDPGGYPYFAANGTAILSLDDAAHSLRLHMATRYRGPEGGRRYVTVENPVTTPGAIVRIKIERAYGMA